MDLPSHDAIELRPSAPAWAEIDRDIEALQREVNFKNWFGKSKMVDKDGNPRRFFHGTNWQFTRFDPDMAGQTDDGYFGRGMYFFSDREPALTYGGIVKEVFLKMENPFRIPSAGTCGHSSLIDLREKLATLVGGPHGVAPVKTLPEGYEVSSFEKPNPYKPQEMLTIFRVLPKPELYESENVRYGPHCQTELEAIVNFNDELRDSTEFSSPSWTPDLLKSFDRKNLHKLLQSNGYDGIVVFDPEFDDSEDEFVVFRSDQIKSAVMNNGKFDPNDPDSTH